MTKHHLALIGFVGVLIGGSLVVHFFLQASPPEREFIAPPVVQQAVDRDMREAESIAPGTLPDLSTETSAESAPLFRREMLGGGHLSLASYAGKKPVILDFFTTWCHNCRRDMPVQQKLYEKYKDDVEVIAINVEEKRSVVERYIENNNMTFPVVFDDDGSVARLYDVSVTNLHILIDKNGMIVKIVPGDILEEHFIQLVQ